MEKCCEYDIRKIMINKTKRSYVSNVINIIALIKKDNAIIDLKNRITRLFGSNLKAKQRYKTSAL